MYALGSLLFPRFNLLCLPGPQHARRARDRARPSRTAGTSAPSCWSTARSAATRACPTSPANLGGLTAAGRARRAVLPPAERGGLPAGSGPCWTCRPCGAVAGVLARTDANRGVWKAPAGRRPASSRSAASRKPPTTPVSGVLNPRGVNVLRSLPGRGHRSCGARARSRATTRAGLRVQVRAGAAADRLHREPALPRHAVRGVRAQRPGPLGTAPARRGELHARALPPGGVPAEREAAPSPTASSSICDETVNPQSEIDLGRVNVVVGFAPLKPAEFVVITITQLAAGGLTMAQFTVNPTRFDPYKAYMFRVKWDGGVRRRAVEDEAAEAHHRAGVATATAGTRRTSAVARANHLRRR